MDSDRSHTCGGAEALYTRSNQRPEAAQIAPWTGLLQSTSVETMRISRSARSITVGDIPESSTSAQTMPMHRKRLASMTPDTHRKRSLIPSDDLLRPSGTRARPIDLTSSPPRLGFTAALGLRDTSSVCTEAREDTRHSSHIRRPPWQPDGDALACPVCKEHFTWYFRKHHCRKCGRVVCANCSQHRVTMPRQFIVQAPDEVHSDQPLAMNSTTFSLNGAETVRVCNPCVPDPNFSPLAQSFNRSARYESHGEQSSVQEAESTSSRARSRASLPLLQEALGPGQLFPASSIYRPDFPFAPSHRTSHSSNVIPTLPSIESPPAPFPRPNHRRATLSSVSAPLQHRSASLSTRDLQRFESHQDNFLASSTPIQAYSQRPQLAEEDECPVCGNELPPRNASDDDAARARHVEQCINSYGSFRAGPAMPENSITSSSHLSATSDPRYAAGPSTLGSGNNLARPVLSEFATIVPSASGLPVLPPLSHTHSAPAFRRRAARMLEYKASEKDCVDDRGEEQECVICFEEFEVGDDMGRLECLCKFHKRCILSWWRAKESADHGSLATGGCPTHVLQI